MVAGGLLAPLCVYGLGWHWQMMWVLCPQALFTMFLRQALHAYDSLGAPGCPDLLVAACYYPAMGWLLGRAFNRGHVCKTALACALGHAVALGLAWGALELRDRMWGIA